MSIYVELGKGVREGKNFKTYANSVIFEFGKNAFRLLRIVLFLKVKTKKGFHLDHPKISSPKEPKMENFVFACSIV